MVSVGIVSGKKICFSFNGRYTVNDRQVEGAQEAMMAHGLIHWDGMAFTET